MFLKISRRGELPGSPPGCGPDPSTSAVPFWPGVVSLDRAPDINQIISLKCRLIRSSARQDDQYMYG